MANLQNSYNGWKNYETWTVMLYIHNDYYLATHHFDEAEKAQITSYKKFIKYFELENQSTDEGTHYLDSKLDYPKLDEAIKEMMVGVAL